MNPCNVTRTFVETFLDRETCYKKCIPSSIPCHYFTWRARKHDHLTEVKTIICNVHTSSLDVSRISRQWSSHLKSVSASVKVYPELVSEFVLLDFLQVEQPLPYFLLLVEAADQVFCHGRDPGIPLRRRLHILILHLHKNGEVEKWMGVSRGQLPTLILDVVFLVSKFHTPEWCTVHPRRHVRYQCKPLQHMSLVTTLCEVQLRVNCQWTCFHRKQTVFVQIWGDLGHYVWQNEPLKALHNGSRQGNWQLLWHLIVCFLGSGTIWLVLRHVGTIGCSRFRLKTQVNTQLVNTRLHCKTSVKPCTVYIPAALVMAMFLCVSHLTCRCNWCGMERESLSVFLQCIYCSCRWQRQNVDVTVTVASTLYCYIHSSASQHCVCVCVCVSLKMMRNYL